MRNIKFGFKNKDTWIVIIAALIAALVVFGVLMHVQHEELPMAQVMLPSISYEVASSSQQTVDTRLSLTPSSSSVGTHPPVPTGCALNLAFEIKSGDLAAAGEMDYELIAKNVGGSSCASASLSVYYAQNEHFVAGSPGPTANGYYWRLGDLKPGAVNTITLSTNRTAVSNGSVSSDEACLSADNGSDACANASTNAPSSFLGESGMPALQAATSALLSPSGRELGVWVWTPVTQMSLTDMQNVVNEASANNFTAIYMTVDDYLTKSSLDSYTQAITRFLALASQKNIVVDAEAGARNWGQPGNTGQADQILDFVAAYNVSHSIKFRGVQYDVEPYLLPAYQNDQAGVLTNYANMVADVVAHDKNYGLPITIIVPHFYDANEQWTPQVNIGGVTDYTYRQILRYLSTVPGSHVIIMAYRNFASGADGSIELSNSEIKEANQTNVSVLVAQETGPVTPSYVTFYGLSRKDLATQVGYINQTFNADRSFGGIAIDYLDPFLNIH